MAQAYVRILRPQQPLRGAHNMAAFVAKYVSSQLGPNSMAPCAYTILPYLSEVLDLAHLAYQEGRPCRRAHSEEDTASTERKAGISGNCNSEKKTDTWMLFAVFYSSTEPVFLHTSEHVAVALHTSHLQSTFCQTRCNMSLCNNFMHFMCIKTIGISTKWVTWNNEKPS
jgi:hypothetical protein